MYIWLFSGTGKVPTTVFYTLKTHSVFPVSFCIKEKGVIGYPRYGLYLSSSITCILPKRIIDSLVSIPLRRKIILPNTCYDILKTRVTSGAEVK